MQIAHVARPPGAEELGTSGGHGQRSTFIHTPDKLARLMGAKKRKTPAKKPASPPRHGLRPERAPPATRRGSSQPVIGFIGAGNMSRSLTGGLLRNGWARQALVLSDADPRQCKAVKSIFGVDVYADNNQVANRADILVFAIKPQALKAAALGVANSVQRNKPLIVSIAAGVRSSDLERWLGGELPVVRVMPNTAALIGSGAAGMYANSRVGVTMRNQAESILRSVGVAVCLDREELIDIVTALSGTGPAYFFFVLEALEEAAIECGLDRNTARLLTLETAFGAAKMALEGAEEPKQLRARVTSPGGTTEAAIKVLEDGGLKPLFQRAITTAAERARELGADFGASK